MRADHGGVGARLYLPQVGCLLIALAFGLLMLLPYVMVGVMQQALAKLHLSGGAALLAVAGILVGGLVNYPVARIERPAPPPPPPSPLLQLLGWGPFAPRARSETVVAVNLGGCVIPTLLAAYEALHVVAAGGWPVAAMGAATGGAIWVCHRAARPVPGVGIALPALLAPLTAVFLAWLLLPHPAWSGIRASTAFVAGVAGPLVGADLLHWREFSRVSASVVSIGGAGTFDGIVLSGVLAALLA